MSKVDDGTDRERDSEREREREREKEREYMNGWREALRRHFIGKTFYDCVDYSPLQFLFNYKS